MQWLVELRCLTDSECMCVLQGKSLTANTAGDIVFSPQKLISGQLLCCVTFCLGLLAALYSAFQQIESSDLLLLWPDKIQHKIMNNCCINIQSFISMNYP